MSISELLTLLYLLSAHSSFSQKPNTVVFFLLNPRLPQLILPHLSVPRQRWRYGYSSLSQSSTGFLLLPHLTEAFNYGSTISLFLLSCSLLWRHGWKLNSGNIKIFLEMRIKYQNTLDGKSIFIQEYLILLTLSYQLPWISNKPQNKRSWNIIRTLLK